MFSHASNHYISKFMAHYPKWKMKYSIEMIVEEMVDAAKRRANNA